MNRLAEETSPYLRQHADNPVDWYPWGEDAFARARQEDKPVLLSVGYSSCHWCHVMAHESFEDEQVAGLMNELFVNIKVDREERPDVDALYMEAVQAISGHGGWPMTVFLTPEGEPFFGGTYFPKAPRGGMTSFPELLERVSEIWHTRRADAVEQAGELTKALGRTARLEAGDSLPDEGVVDTARRGLRAQHDDRRGGFGTAPKFPQAMSLEVVIRDLASSKSPVTQAMLEMSLDAMASGGIYDHIGGGFSRYSVDAVWLVPHFEKMLYDQALIARSYLHAWQVTGHDRYRQVLAETIDYVLRDLRDDSGGFYSAEDADSEGEEGRFYVWTPDEVRQVLGDEAQAEQVCDYYGIRDGGNFESTGRSIPNRLHAVGQLERPAHIESARLLLFAARANRTRPGLDDKVLAEWNALMTATLAEAAVAAEEAIWLDAAVANGELIVQKLRRDDGRWLRSWQPRGEARHLAVASDYGALIDAFTRLAEATGESRWISYAREAADGLLELFWDEEQGGVFTTGRDAETLIARNKDVMDNASPGANSLVAVSLLRLAALTGDQRYQERAEATVRLAGRLAADHPTAFAYLLHAVELLSHGIDEIVIPGARSSMTDTVQQAFLPYAVLAWGDPYDSPLWADREEGKAYVCRNFTCNLPVTTPGALRADLQI